MLAFKNEICLPPPKSSVAVKLTVEPGAKVTEHVPHTAVLPAAWFDKFKVVVPPDEDTVDVLEIFALIAIFLVAVNVRVLAEDAPETVTALETVISPSSAPAPVVFIVTLLLAKLVANVVAEIVEVVAGVHVIKPPDVTQLFVPLALAPIVTL